MLGVLGRLHPTLNDKYGLGRHQVLVADLDLETIVANIPYLHRFTPISLFPPVLQDIALVVDEALPAARVSEEIRTGGGQLLKQVRLFDVYRGPNLPAGKKSLAFALTFQSDQTSLTEKEVAKVHSQIVNRLTNVLGASLRA
jgi:phenylalanyl-tRNA synthetase beta chain